MAHQCNWKARTNLFHCIKIIIQQMWQVTRLAQKPIWLFKSINYRAWSICIAKWTKAEVRFNNKLWFMMRLLFLPCLDMEDFLVLSKPGFWTQNGIKLHAEVCFLAYKPALKYGLDPGLQTREQTVFHLIQKMLQGSNYKKLI